MSGFLLGWEEPQSSGFGFASKVVQPDPGTLVSDSGDGHVMVIAGTGAGKTRSVAIPNALHWDGPAIVLDIKGELAETTARYRQEELGQEIVVLDPWHRTRFPSASLNPLDVLGDPKALADDCYVLASMLSPPPGGLNEAFWIERGEALIAGMMAHIATDQKDTDRSLGRLFDMLHGDDVMYKSALTLDLEGKGMAPFAYTQISALLQTADKTRESIVSTAQSAVRVMAGDLVRDVVGRTSFDLEKVTSGAPMTIYIVVPAENLRSHASLIRLWVSCLLSLITRRRAAPAKSTLFLLDELAQLGRMEQVVSLVTLCRSYGVRACLVLQSLAQLAAYYPLEHRVLIENCATIFATGLTATGAAALSEALGDISAETLIHLGRGQAVAKQAFTPTRIVRKLDYLTDSMFASRFDANPMFRHRGLER